MTWTNTLKTSVTNWPEPLSAGPTHLQFMSYVTWSSQQAFWTPLASVMSVCSGILVRRGLGTFLPISKCFQHRHHKSRLKPAKLRSNMPISHSIFLMVECPFYQPSWSSL